MHPRDILHGALLACLMVSGAQACPDHAASVTATKLGRSASHGALVAWKPRAWTPPAMASAPAPVSAGLRVERDPVDGTLSMPAPDRFRDQLVEGERRPLSVMRNARGGTRAQLGDDFAEYAVVRIGADGKPFWTCVSGPAAADRLLKTPAVPKREPAPGTVWEVQ